MASITNVRVRSFTVHSLHVFWDWEGPGDPLDYRFMVERSGAAHGPFAPVSGWFRDTYEFVDQTLPRVTGFYTHYYYRIRVQHGPTEEEKVFPERVGVRLEAEPDLYALEAARIEAVRLKQVDGRMVWHFPRRRFGARCSCYDQVTRKTKRSNCATCFGTTIVGGFNTPVINYVQIIEPQKSVMRANVAEIGVENTYGRFAVHPEPQPGDVIVETENIRWKVGDGITVITKSRAPIRYMAPLSRISRGDAEYQIPVDVANLGNLRGSPHWDYGSLFEIGADKTKLDIGNY